MARRIGPTVERPDGRSELSAGTVPTISGNGSRTSDDLRRPTVEGTFNFRDLGGVITSSGHALATGLVFGSASLDGITDRGIDTLRALGIRTVIDLRSDHEVRDHGVFPDERLAVRWEHLAAPFGPPGAGSGAMSVEQQAILDHPDPMAVVYVELMKQMAGEFARCLRILSNPANLPAVVHGTSGKDRTGLLAAILHLTAGVPLQVALDAYEVDGPAAIATRRHMIERFPALGTLPPGKLDRMCGTNRGWVLSALAVVSGHGGLDQWLAANGCDRHHQIRLRTTLVQRKS